jgi:RHS repeat-associated protein
LTRKTIHTLDAIYHSEGRLKYNGTTPRYEYTLSDHLGNGRVYYTDANGDGIITASDILQDNHYYPFGLNHTDPRRNTGGVGVNLYQYNGKELVEDAGLGWHAYGKRYYDAAIGRFPNVDPLIDTFHFVTGYNYAENEPVAGIDLWGLQRVAFQSEALATKVKEGARDAGKFLGYIEGAALGTTAVSGGYTAPVTVPIGIIADNLSKGAVVVELIADGGIDNESMIDGVVELVSPIMSAQVKEYIIKPVIKDMKPMWDSAKKGLQATADGVQNALEEGFKKMVGPEPPPKP